MSTDISSYSQLWLISCEDGSEFAYTDFDSKISYKGRDYYPQYGFDNSIVDKRLDLSTASGDLYGIIDDYRIEKEDIFNGKFNGANVNARLYDRQTGQSVKFYEGTIGSVVFQDGRFSAELISNNSNLSKVTTRYYKAQCDAVFGDQRCGINLENKQYHYDASIVDLYKNVVEIEKVGNVSFDENWFTKSRLKSLDQDAQSMFSVRSGHIINGNILLKLWVPVKSYFQSGEVVRIIAGCDGQFNTCAEKFQNAVNFRGFPYLSDH